jgi:hypothetical protein
MAQIDTSLPDAERAIRDRAMYQVRQSELLRRINRLPADTQVAFVAHCVALGSDAAGRSVRAHIISACAAASSGVPEDNDAAQLAAALPRLVELESWEA